MKVSVIVPAYNSEKYLVEALESLVHQSMDDFEVLLVDDGSSDSTYSILRAYDERYENFHAYTKENGGPASARNFGLDRAQGDYIYFFDSDDLLELDALDAMYDRMIEQKADLVIAGLDTFDQYKRTTVRGFADILKLDTVDKYHPQILMTYSLCNKLFKRSLIEKYGLRLPPLGYSEDGAFMLQYVYRTQKITALNQVVFHYRRMFAGETDSITSSITVKKMQDYIDSHDIMLNTAIESLLRDHPDCSTLDGVFEKDPSARSYIHQLIYKEVLILLTQCYRKFWQTSPEAIRLIVDEVSKKLPLMNPAAYARIVTQNSDLPLGSLPLTPAEMIANAHLTAVLYGSVQDAERFLCCLDSLTVQKLNSMKIMLPASMRETAVNAGYTCENLFYLDAASENELFQKALENVDTEYIIFCDPHTVYAKNAFFWQFQHMQQKQLDFHIELIYHRNYGTPQPTYLQCVAMNSMDKKIAYNEHLNFDHTLSNKFFRAEFLKAVASGETPLIDRLTDFYRKGFFDFSNHGFVIYDSSLEDFSQFICAPGHDDFLAKYTKETPVRSLTEKEFAPDTGLSLLKRIALKKPETKKEEWFFKMVRKMEKAPVKNRTLFYSIRKANELEGNAKALFPHIKGKKKVFAYKTPHSMLQQLYAFWLFSTSKVIIVDDYARYLRHFTLKPEQRVIQLWHACGAFKQFGQYGTNMKLSMDKATHIQYSLVTVSGEAVRPIYADAFNIDVQRVKSLGCPRTDDFFNEDLILAKQKKILKKYPYLKDKHVLLYAPTFRDIGQDRTRFKPEIDFQKLSDDLPEDQILLIGPHPVMTNEIIDKEYSNIKVIRDFSTNDLMLISDLLITDYSSVIFEYALLNKPIVFFCYDLDTYNRGFYLNYPDDLPGEVFETQAALTEYLQQPDRHIVSGKHEAFIRKYMTACDGHSCERIAGLINDYLEGK